MSPFCHQVILLLGATTANRDIYSRQQEFGHWYFSHRKQCNLTITASLNATAVMPTSATIAANEADDPTSEIILQQVHQQQLM
jgi:hypothetical protein